MRQKRSGTSESSDTVMRRSPASRSGRASFSSSVAFVVSARSSTPSDATYATSSVTRGCSSGSPPVMRTRRTPACTSAWTMARHASSSSRFSRYPSLREGRQ